MPSGNMPSGFSISTDFLKPPPAKSLNDLAGPWYTEVIGQLHEILQPASYFEIGIDRGATLALGDCRAVAVDPSFDIGNAETIQKILAKPAISLFRMRSDDFFAAYDLTALLGRPVDLALLDGMHRCEFLLRDFIHVERHCKRNSIVMLHDCLPVEEAITHRALPEMLDTPIAPVQPHRHNWWTGDVWRTALLLKRVRPDLQMTALNAAPTGLILITNLNAEDTMLHNNYAHHVSTMMSWHLSEIGLAALFAEMQVQPTASVMREDQLTARFWL